MSIDAFDALQLPDEPVVPDARFAAALRARVAAALAALDADPPLVDLPQRRSTTVTDTTTTTTRARSAGAFRSTLVPYICVRAGREALAWYGEVFGAVETVRYDADDGRVGHAEISVGGALLMLSDEYPELGVVSPTSLGGTSGTLHLSVSDVDAVHARAVGAGATSMGEPEDKAYGERSATIVDPFGHRWMIQTPIAAPTPEQIAAEVEGYTITAAAPESTPVELGYFTLGTPDTARAARFYGALFGWAPEPGNLGDGYAHITNTSLPLGLTPDPADSSPVLYFRVGDVARYATRVRELGGEVISEQEYASGANADCRDDQGRAFQLWQPAEGY